MIGKNASYTLQPKNTKEKDYELTGKEGMDISFVAKTAVPIPPTFILSSQAFDDFISINNLVEPISQSLSTVEPFIQQTARSASQEISKYIIESRIPKTLERPIIETYKNMSFHETPTVNIFPSHIIEKDFIPDSDFNLTYINGLENVLASIKKIWLSLFTTEAIELRINKYYKGPITISAVIQKVIKSEISGKFYSFSKNEPDLKIAEIHAMYGLYDSKIHENQSADIYLVKKDSEEIIQKNIRPQDFMIIAKRKMDSNLSPKVKIEISDSWKKTQKLADELVLRVSNIGERIENALKTPIEINFGIEAGDLFVFDEKPINFDPAIFEKKKEEPPKKIPEIKPRPNINLLKKEVEEIVKQEKIPEVLIEEKKKVLLTLKKTTENHTEKWINSLETKTPLYLDVSKMNTSRLNFAQSLDGAFFDGTEALLSSGILPEEVLHDKFKLNEEIERLALDYSNALLALKNKEFIYKFSSITEAELKLLNIPENKYKHFNDERFIAFPESLTVEVLALKKAKNNNSFRNLCLCLPDIRSLKNFFDLKKIISANSLRRSSVLKFYAEISIPSFIFELDAVENTDLDGFIFNYEKFLKMIFYRNEVRESDHSTVINIIESIKTICKKKKFELFVLLPGKNSKILKEIAKFDLEGIIFSSIPEEDDVKTISETENPLELKEAGKAGRKMKDLF